MNKTRLFLILFPVLMLVLASMACVPAQDCGGVTFSVQGYVEDSNEIPLANVKIRVWNQGSFERPSFELQTTSNSGGYFRTESAFSYACTPFYIEVTATDFEVKTLTYYPPGEGFGDELPSEITIQLQRQKD